MYDLVIDLFRCMFVKIRLVAVEAQTCTFHAFNFTNSVIWRKGLWSVSPTLEHCLKNMKQLRSLMMLKFLKKRRQRSSEEEKDSGGPTRDYMGLNGCEAHDAVAIT